MGSWCGHLHERVEFVAQEALCVQSRACFRGIRGATAAARRDLSCACEIFFAAGEGRVCVCYKVKASSFRRMCLHQQGLRLVSLICSKALGQLFICGVCSSSVNDQTRGRASCDDR